MVILILLFCIINITNNTEIPNYFRNILKEFQIFSPSQTYTN